MDTHPFVSPWGDASDEHFDRVENRADDRMVVGHLPVRRIAALALELPEEVLTDLAAVLDEGRPAYTQNVTGLVPPEPTERPQPRNTVPRSRCRPLDARGLSLPAAWYPIP